MPRQGHGTSPTLEDPLSRNIHYFLSDRLLISYHQRVVQICPGELARKALARWPMAGGLGTKTAPYGLVLTPRPFLPYLSIHSFLHQQSLLRVY